MTRNLYSSRKIQLSKSLCYKPSSQRCSILNSPQCSFDNTFSFGTDWAPKYDLTHLAEAVFAVGEFGSAFQICRPSLATLFLNGI